MPSPTDDKRFRGAARGPVHGLLALALAALLTACAAPGGAPSANPSGSATAAPGTAATPAAAPAPPPQPPAPPPPPPILPFDDAVLSAATALLERAQLAGDAPGGRYDVVIDPLIDGVTGQQSVATKAMGARIVKLIQDAHPRYAVQPFNTDAVKKGPLLLVGTFTGVNAERKTEGQREAFRICLALADLKTGKLVSKGLAFAKADGVDLTPLPPFRDAPAWTDDAANNGYIRTCQGTRAGDVINPQYVQRIVASAAIAEAGDAYSAGKYANALKLYQTAASTPGGEQLRTYTGLYLASWRLGRQADASKAFGKIVEQGLESKKLGVKFLFKPGTTVLWSDPKAGPPAPYAMWIREISRQAVGTPSCLGVVGHTSATGSEPLNEKLSLQRAEIISKELVRMVKTLDKKVVPNGVGSKQTLIGNGRDDQTDALDRRVEFKVVGC